MSKKICLIIGKLERRILNIIYANTPCPEDEVHRMFVAQTSYGPGSKSSYITLSRLEWKKHLIIETERGYILTERGKLIVELFDK
jgi:predicted transcriptional regulator